MIAYGDLFFAEKEEDIPIHPYLMKLPPSLRNKLIKWRLNLQYEERTVWGIKGHKIQMPITYTIYRTMPLPIRKSFFEKMEKELLKQGIHYVVLPKLMDICPFNTIKICSGNDVKLLFIMDVIQFIVEQKVVSKDLKDLEVIILDGNKKDAQMILDLIYPKLNYISLITKSPETFKQQIEEIFEDVGLNVQLLSYNKEAISQGDIIIDTHYDDPSVIRFCKKASVYVDMGNHAAKTAMLLERQSEIPIIDGFLLMQNNETVSIAEAEAILTIKNLLHTNYKITMKKLKKEEIQVYNLTRYNY